ncbi:MAG TPA: alpha/beta hydrolase, partial [Candidatus Binatia bacterium]|nr:alpha/beta hydrolase [Candidatus Binatia bacterium]
MRYHHGFVDVGGVTLHVVEAGPAAGPLVILLHGFPEYWYGWRNQIPALAQAGYRVCTPDQRGYNLSDKPADLEAYNLDYLAADVRALIHLHSRERAYVVGHDWGAAVAWWVAIKFASVVHKLVILNVPHPIVGRRFARQSREQLLRSWYIALFQLSWLPERLLRLNNWQPLRTMMLA